MQEAGSIMYIYNNKNIYIIHKYNTYIIVYEGVCGEFHSCKVSFTQGPST